MIPRVLLALALAAPLSAAELTIVLDDRATAPSPMTAVLRPLRDARDLDGGQVQTHRIEGEKLVIDLPRGHWSLEIDSETRWHARQIFTISDATAISATLLPAATIEGRIDGVSAIDAQLHNEQGAFEVTCPVVEKTFRCRVPAGTFDVRLRAAGRIPRFLTNLRVPASLGELKLEKGASLVGRIEVEEGVRAQDMGIVATPIDGNGAAVRGTIEKKNIFHVDGLLPGRYSLRAFAGEHFASAPLEVEIRANAMAELRDAVRIEKPKRIAVAITPPLDPQGRPWHVRLARNIGRDEVETVADGDATSSGEWLAKRLRGGSYTLTLATQSGSTWRAELIELASDVTLPIDVAMRKVRGVVTHRGKPLEATISLSANGTQVKFESDDEGRFTGAVPDEKRWTAIVKSETPPIHFEREVTLPDSGALAIEVPSTTLSGFVRDPQGKPVTDALINVTGKTFVQLQPEHDGSFAVHGLPAGAHRVQAKGFLQESDVVTIDVAGDDTPEPVLLTMRDEQQLAGRVTSDFGPVAGAQVWVFPTDAAVQLISSETTDSFGAFRTTIPPGAKQIDVIVHAPGFGFRMLHTNVREGELNVRVDQRGGTLVVNGEAGERVPYLVRDGAMIFAGIATRQPRDDHHYVINGAEPGAWSLCMLTRGERELFRAGRLDPARHCTNGFLAPFGTLELAAAR